MADISYKELIAPSFYSLWNDIVQRKYPEIWLAGGRGCIDGDTLISTPDFGMVKVSEFQGGKVFSANNELTAIEEAYADKPTRFTKEDLYEVKTEGGRSILVTDQHEFLTPLWPKVYRKTKDLQVGNPVIVYDCFTHRTVWDYIKSITFAKRDYYWDLNVHGTHNYCANGFINHNSTKSSFVSTVIPLLMEMNPKLHCVCFRKYGTNLADSVYSQFEFTINEKLRPIAHHWLFKKSPLKIVNVNTGQQILFRGLDDPQKAKSLKAPFGYFGLIWFEELAEFDGMEEIRNVLQSLRRGGHYFQTFCSFNPPESSSSWIVSEMNTPQIIDGKQYRYVHKSDYRSVPKEWLGEDFFKSAQLLRDTNERAYRHEYLGETTGNGGAVFPNVVPIEMSDEMIAQFDNRRYGLDFGFSLDPAAYTASYYNHNHRDLYIYDEIYKPNLTNMDLAAMLNEKKDEIGFNYIMCDSAEPKSIAELESLGVNVLPARKGPDSIRFGIRWLQSLAHIYIDPIRCPNTYREFSRYEYEKNKSGLFISRYPDFDNHSIDSIRYATEEDATNSGFF